MGRRWDITDLEQWDTVIHARALDEGLDCFPQEFEVCDHEQMLGYMAYHGMPAHYPHWSYGKAYEKLKTMYSYGVSGLPYEMVINANPSLAYLMRGNSLCLQLLTIAHVYGHNDFFKNNFTFRDTRPELSIAHFKLRADRVRSYIEDPSIGLPKVEEVLDAAHALSLQCRRNTAVRKLAHEEQQMRALQAAQPPADPYRSIHVTPSYHEPDLTRVPIEPEEDILLFIAEHQPYLAEWQRDLLHMVHQESRYFMPQIETKIMNEGWASYWHHHIMSNLELPEDLHLEFLVHHNQVIRPHRGGINPYHVGFMVWHDIERRFGRAAMFEVRETDRDVSFLRRFLTEELMRELDMFEYETNEGKRVVSRVADEEHWEAVKRTLLQNVGMGSVPVIVIADADYHHNRILYLQHQHDGRDLQLDYLKQVLAYTYRLWSRQVLLETKVQDQTVTFFYDSGGFGRLNG